MSKRMTRIGIVVLVAVMAFGVIGTAAAQGPDGRRPLDRFRDGPRRDRVIRTLVEAVADATGLTRADVLPELRDGKTFAEILVENGLDPDAVLADVLATMTEEINQALADDKISEENAARALEELPGLLEDAMNGELRDRIRERVIGRLGDTAVGVLAEMAGVDVEDVVKDIATPPSLAEIAESYGLDPDAVIAEIETRITDEVNQAVADGEISAEDATDILEGLHDRLVERFNAPIRPFRPHLRPGPGGQGI
jgi:uncharacterized protein YidB (DUF937 family)